MRRLRGSFAGSWSALALVGLRPALALHGPSSSSDFWVRFDFLSESSSFRFRSAVVLDWEPALTAFFMLFGARLGRTIASSVAKEPAKFEANKINNSLIYGKYLVFKYGDTSLCVFDSVCVVCVWSVCVYVCVCANRKIRVEMNALRVNEKRIINASGSRSANSAHLL
ncbi:hypothetical protein BpHYR1_052042 [Brachionus plicatilis]|uniref:Secreted protein n=1 Tax=Brachionus plicatilis TaxID=10195 RepID=A0A3M7RHT9_BRAPC|nr:hypothetical protein BpHYR1_052042 [Brachionus plicatilis]